MQQLADLLILKQPTDQLGARIFPFVTTQAPWQQHLRLDPQQPGRHLEVIRRLVQSQLVDDGEELIGDLRNREVSDVDLVFADQVQQQIQRARELLEPDNQPSSALGRGL